MRRVRIARRRDEREEGYRHTGWTIDFHDPGMFGNQGLADARPSFGGGTSYAATGTPMPSFSAAIFVPSTRFAIFWNATSRA